MTTATLPEPGEAVPPDQGARDAIAHDLDVTLFVEAGAGSGKTRGLVERIGHLVLSGEARIEEVAAITFTEAAAAELRDRIGELLEHAAAEPGDRSRAVEALAALDSAAITTLHGFCRRILAEHPFEAGLPPIFDVYDEARSAVAFEERWRETVDILLDQPADARALQRVIVCGGSLDGLRSLARQLGDNWDLLTYGDGAPDLPAVDPAALLASLDAALALAETCTDDDDLLLAHLRSLEPFTQLLREAAERDELSLLDALVGRDKKLSAGNRGRSGSWAGCKSEVLDYLASAEEERQALVGRAADGALRRLCASLADRTLAAAADRRRAGHLEFHDLLVLARDLVRDLPGVRAALRQQYRYLLIDEYQDTDPIQAELALLVASGDRPRPTPDGALAPSADGAPEVPDPWGPVSGGRLFFVGDPIQSIYGFRRANLELFLRTKERVPDRCERLTSNFRSVPGIVAWVDAVFGVLVGAGDGVTQPAFVGSLPARHALAGAGAAVTVLGADQPPAASADEALEREAAEIAAVARAVVREGWTVGNGERAARFSDVTVLIPTRRSLQALQTAFDAARVPYRLESSSLVFASAEVRELVAVLRAIDDPADELATVAALRSPGFGCGDDDLVRHRMAGGTWDYRDDPPPATGHDDAVGAGLRWLRLLHGQRQWLDVSALVDHVVEERRLLLLALDDQRWRDGWRRIRFVLDQARRFSESSAGDLRRFLDWLDVQAADDAGVTEVVLPEADQEAVRVMTVHAAKGLEFPVVVVAGLGGERRQRGPAVYFGPQGLEAGLRKELCTAGYGSMADRRGDADRQEQLRLLYVAVTRAQDHLVVSAHRSQRAAHSSAARLQVALAEVDGDLWASYDAAGSPGESAPDGAHPAEALVREPELPDRSVASEGMHEGPEDRDAWIADRERMLAIPPTVVSATAVARLGATTLGGDAGDGVDIEDAGSVDDAKGALGTPDRPGWRRGRAGTAIGRAVHAVLQAVDLPSGDGLEPLAATYADAEGVPGRVGEIATLARAALASDTVRRAIAGRRYWRELYVGVPVGARVLEGFVDLLFEGDDGMEVVDYKTDQVGGDEDVGSALDRYRLQGAAYALAVEEALGRPVERCTFLFLRPGGAEARSLADLDAAKDAVRALLRDGTLAGPFPR